MNRVLVSILLVITYVIAPRLQGREWTDSTGNHSIEADYISCHVVLRLPTGETKTIDLDKLSQNDREYLAEVLTRSKTDVPRGTNGKNDKSDKNAAEGAKSDTIANGRRVPADALVLTEEREWQNVKHAILADDGFFSFESQSLPVNEFHHYQQALKSLSEVAPQEKEIASAFAERLTQLRSAPAPNDRVEAAYRLSGATGIAEQAIPALLQTLEKDVSSKVQLAAVASLTGFGPTAKVVIPTLVKRIDSGDPSGIYLFALLKIGGDSPQLRKIVKKTIDAYRTGHDSSNFHRITHDTALLGENTNWAVNPLLQNAEIAIKRDDSGNVKGITSALLNIASSDARVLRFYETQAKDGPVPYREYCDSIAKQLRLKVKQ